MKFYLIQIQNLTDGSVVPGIYTYENKDKAEAVFHQKLASDINSEAVISTIVKVLDNSGNVVFSEYWQKSYVVEGEVE